MIYKDIRQSDEWSEYLKMYGWNSVKLESKNILRFLRFGPFCIGKLHRPYLLDAGALEELQEAVKKYGLTSLKISQMPQNKFDLVRLARFKEQRNPDLPPSTILLSLKTSENGLWDNFLPVCRSSINRSTRDGDITEIICSPSVEVTERYYQTLSLRGRNKGFIVLSFKDHLRKIEMFKDKAFIANVYSKNKQLLGTKMFLGFGKAIWYMHGAITDSGQKSNSGHLLIWEAIKHFKKLGYEMMDFEGASDNRLKKLSKGWKNYTNFKLKFGGSTTQYPLPVIKYYKFLSFLNW